MPQLIKCQYFQQFSQFCFYVFHRLGRDRSRIERRLSEYRSCSPTGMQLFRALENGPLSCSRSSTNPFFSYICFHQLDKDFFAVFLINGPILKNPFNNDYTLEVERERWISPGSSAPKKAKVILTAIFVANNSFLGNTRYKSHR